MPRWIAAVAMLAMASAAQAALRVTVASHPEGSVWTLRTTLEPAGTSLRGMPLSRFDPAWCVADELTADAFPAALHDTGEWPLGGAAGREGRFAMAGEFGSGRYLELFLGVYRQCDGQRRTFLAVLDPAAADGAGGIVQVETLTAGDAAVLHLLGEPGGDGFGVRSCVACDDEGQHFLWDERARRFSPQPHEERDI